MVWATNDPGRPRWLALETHTGETVATGGITVTSQSRALVLRLPGIARVWHRPTAVLVARDGRTTRLPIHDVTRLAQGAIVGASLLLTLASRVLTTKSKGATPWAAHLTKSARQTRSIARWISPKDMPG